MNHPGVVWTSSLPRISGARRSMITGQWCMVPEPARSGEEREWGAPNQSRCVGSASLSSSARLPGEIRFLALAPLLGGSSQEILREFAAGGGEETPPPPAEGPLHG